MAVQDFVPAGSSVSGIVPESSVFSILSSSFAVRLRQFLSRNCVFATRRGIVQYASQQRKEKRKKTEIKETNDPWTCTRMRPAGCSILPPRLPSRRPSSRTTLPPTPDDPQARTTGKTGHPRRQTRMEPPQSLQTLICTTLAWATFLVSTACTPSPACSQFSLTGYFQRHRLPLHPSLLRLPSSTTPTTSSFLPFLPPTMP